jgi:threonine/homoserine/homoserine lactone efflux protein
MVGLPFILKGFLIGIIAAVPVGPIMMLTIQKSVSDGRKAGFSCGLGGTAVDTLCAIISAFALSSIDSYVQTHTAPIEIIGGLFIMFVGFNMFRSRIPQSRRKKPYSPKNFIKAFTMGLSNPAALAVMLALFAFFSMDMSGAPVWVPIVSIAALAFGSALFWYTLSRVAAHFGDRFNLRVLYIINRLAAVAIFIFGAILLFKGLSAL